MGCTLDLVVNNLNNLSITSSDTHLVPMDVYYTICWIILNIMCLLTVPSQDGLNYFDQFDFLKLYTVVKSTDWNELYMGHDVIS